METKENKIKIPLPFFLRIVLCFFLLDGTEKAYYLIDKYFSTPHFRLFYPPNMLYLIVMAFDFLLVTQLVMRIKLIRLWVTFYLVLNLFYQAFYFVQINPQDWYMLSDQGRIFQAVTVIINFLLLWYIHSPQCCDVLTE